MSLHLMSIDEKIEAVERVILLLRATNSQPPGTLENLKAVAADLRARQELPTSNALGELERALFRVKQSKTGLGYDEGKLIAVANTVISKWPMIRQALEQFGEESAE